MKTVVLTLGPRGAGKTTFCKKVVQTRPEVALVERDAVFAMRQAALVTFLGDAGALLDNGGYEASFRVAMQHVENLLRQESVTIILDTWTELPEHRRRLIQRLRELGADRVVGWIFITPEDDIVRQFIARENTPTSSWRDMGSAAVRISCKQYREQLVDLKQIFDRLVEINPMQQHLFPLGDEFFR